MHSAKAAAVRFGKFSLSSLSSSVVDLAAFALLCEALRPAMPEAAAIIAATIAARVLSSLCNYLINYFLVFHSHTAHGRSASLYTVITVIKTLASALLVAALAGLLPAAVPELAIKIPVDVALFFVNYLVQKAIVY
ncbi:MAG: GtrA family protein [Blautia massiliensis (ex Durand et al. 2017)]